MDKTKNNMLLLHPHGNDFHVFNSKMNLAAETGILNCGLPEVCYSSVVVGIGVEPPGIGKSQSPITEFIADDEAASVCPLLTPSPPPPVEFEHPLALPSAMGYDHQLSPSSTDPELSALPTVNSSGTLLQNLDHSVEGPPDLYKTASSVQSMIESSSSGSSVLHETTACAQLLSNHHYQHLTKVSDEDPFSLQESVGKPVLTGIQLATRKSTENYCFLDWNWPLIRKISLLSILSLLVACMCVVVGMVAQLPLRCDPPRAWWQGSLFYEIFPASFHDYNSDGMGDLRGIVERAAYFQSLGVQVVHLNSIFATDHYPDHFEIVKNLTKLDTRLGTLKDFELTVRTLHDYNISVVIDLPLHPFIELQAGVDTSSSWIESRVFSNEDFVEATVKNNRSDLFLTSTSINVIIGESNDDIKKTPNIVSKALYFWLSLGVDGFYLKGLESLIDNILFSSYIQEWRRVIDNFSNSVHSQKILMCNIKVLQSLNTDNNLDKINAILQRMDLIDVHLDLYTNGTEGIKKSVYELLNGVLYKKPGYPWIHWNIGNIETQRVATMSHSAESNMAAVLFNMFLPGSPSLFYGDEIGLQDHIVPEGEHSEIHPQLVPMHWNANKQGFGFTSSSIIPWLHPSTSFSSVSENQQDVIKRVAMFRDSSPSIYMNGVIKDGIKTPNCEIRVLDSDVIAIQRWYPRRHTYVMVTNLGNKSRTYDLSSWLYGGKIVVDRTVGQNSRIGQYVKFDSLTLNARESIIVKLDK